MNRDAWLTSFSDYLQFEKRYSEHTRLNYQGDIAAFVQFLEKQYPDLNETNVSHHHIRSWVVDLMKSSIQSRSIRRKLSALRHYFKWLERKGIIATQPMQRVPLPKIPERLPKALPPQALSQLLSNLANKEADSESPVLNFRNRVMVAILYGGGLRRAELINLKWTDVDSVRKTLRVIGKGSKYRFIPVGTEMIALLQSWRQLQKESWDNDEYVIVTDSGNQAYPKFIYNQITTLLGSVTTAESKSPHVLRHSMATHMLDKGADLNAVKELLGHSSLAATQVYTKSSMAKLKAVYKQAHPGAQIRE